LQELDLVRYPLRCLPPLPDFSGCASPVHFFISDIAFIPIEVLIVTLIIDLMLESREKQRRMEKLNMLIGTFFSTIGTPLLAQISKADTSLDTVKQRLIIGNDWRNEMFRDVQECLNNYSCTVAFTRVDTPALREFLITMRTFYSGSLKIRWSLNTNRLWISSLPSTT
jgi:hypothetical protein